MKVTSQSSASATEIGCNNAGRKRWSAPRLIVSKVSRKTEKFQSPGTSAEYHESGTTQIS